MKKTAPPTSKLPFTPDDWRKDLELERLRLERSLAEDRRTEIVARLAIDLARARGGRPRKDGGSITPDIEGAVRLLEQARTARLAGSNPPFEDSATLVASFLEELHSNPVGYSRTAEIADLTFEMEVLRESLKSADKKEQRALREKLSDAEKRMKDLQSEKERKGGSEPDPRLLWHIAKHGETPGSGGVVSAKVLCDPSRPADFRIQVGFFSGGIWQGIERWEVLRKAELFRQIVEAALFACLAENSSRMKGKTPSVTASDIEEVLNLPELNLSFFKALVAARKRLESQRKSAAAGGEPKVPRKKSAAWKQ